jgi:hypothetical protein
VAATLRAQRSFAGAERGLAWRSAAVGRVYCINATSESVPKAGLPLSGRVVPLFQGQRFVLKVVKVAMSSRSLSRSARQVHAAMIAKKGRDGTAIFCEAGAARQQADCRGSRSGGGAPGPGVGS